MSSATMNFSNLYDCASTSRRNRIDGVVSHAHKKRVARVGDIVTLRYYRLEPENGFVPEPLFDLSGSNISFVLGWGNYLPGLHEIVKGRAIGDTIEGVSIDAGWGYRRGDLLFEVPIEKLKKIGIDTSILKAGTSLTLKGNVQVLVTSIQDGIVSVDANHPLAGSGYSCFLQIDAIEPIDSERCSSSSTCTGSGNNSRFSLATFALGCFWGSELLYMRVCGVVGTRVGYCLGTTSFPTYEEVCNGKTHHREAVQVLYDNTIVSYEDLVQIAINRLNETASPFQHSLFHDENDDKGSKQYKHAFLFQSVKEKEIASFSIGKNQHLEVDLLHAGKFWPAEEFHQKYLYKGGQSARIGCREKIRCYG